MKCGVTSLLLINVSAVNGCRLAPRTQGHLWDFFNLIVPDLGCKSDPRRNSTYDSGNQSQEWDSNEIKINQSNASHVIKSVNVMCRELINTHD